MANPMVIDEQFVNNLISSAEAFLYTNVVQPYNTAVQGTNFADPLVIKMKPQDEGVIAQVPAIVLPDLPDDYHDPESTGMGDHEVWNYTSFDIEVYPALYTDPGDGAQKPSMESAAIMRSLFMNLRTALSLTISDWSNPASPVAIGGAYIMARIIPVHGAIKTALALHRNRFDVKLDMRYTTASLNG